MERGARWGLLILLLMAFLPMEGTAGKRIVIESAAIVVNNKIATRQEMLEFKQLQEQALRQRFKGEDLRRQLSGLDQAIVEQMVRNLLLEIQAENKGYEIEDREIEPRVSSIIKSNPEVARIYPDKKLREYVQKDIQSKRVLQREVYSRVVVQESEIQEVCKKDGGMGREVDVGHILLRGHGPAVLKRIQTIRENLLAGADFEKTAEEKSEDPSAKRNRGRLGFVAPGQFVKEFENRALSLKVGELSEPVETQFGYHLIRVFKERVTGKGDCEKMDQITRDRIFQELYSRRQDEELNRYFAKLKNKATIRVMFP